MWFINTTTIALERADNIDILSTPYAILSHTWGEDEVTFEDMIDGQEKEKKGYIKIVNTCRLAKERGILYAWVDTCCVDKRSSAELAEAINSMFNWYTFSAVCFAHLEDLDVHRGPQDDELDGLSSCRWFTRGWTLQELIASQKLEFYDSRWNYRGTKAQLRTEISDITGIDVEVLDNNAKLETIPVARRMSWAADRETTRIEDLAYCLLGIFGVNMPMLYGEGIKAFGRLQEEIIKETTDLSIFAWKVDSRQRFRGILARSPHEFAHWPQIRDISYLACMIPDDNGDESRIGVYLTKTADGYVRSRPSELFETQDSLLWAGPRYKIFIRKRVTFFGSANLKKLLCMNLASQFNIRPGIQLASFAAKPADLWDNLRQEFVTDNSEKFTGFLNFQLTDTAKTFISPRIYIVCGLAVDSTSGNMKPWMAIYSSTNKERYGKIIDCVDGYYNSYGEEYYLHQLRDCVLARGNILPQEISLPSNDAAHRLYISLAAFQRSPGSLYTITVNVSNIG
ncbi:Vegetative incompatibility protein HET-E-1 [Fusarium oxysporum f. sp. cubense race 1]|uniref:Vegetative incompatibility protein HET-E-1 n=1 Tax=Fusarium oxysporum f. sp. cubense (strain race 1) TaxID=1229664 RepID=N4TYR6_FUSC1|nr:Vegetative incompatibility protein HET-E-1 [Fusarium oxysporum f. sp. cubense race 1]